MEITFLNVIYAVSTMTLLGLIMGGALLFAHNKIALPPDEKIQKIESILPGVNCGACGFPGCSGYAAAIAKNETSINLCTPGGVETSTQLANLLGLEVQELTKKIAFIRCQGSTQYAELKYHYHGILECRQAEFLYQGSKQCAYSCLGLGSCYRACPFEAITLDTHMQAKINPEKCTGCGLCIPACPRNLIILIPYREEPPVYQTACKSEENALNTRKQCKIGCFGCGLCARNCPVQAITIKNFLSIIDYEKCIACGQCANICPAKSIQVIKKEKHIFHLL